MRTTKSAGFFIAALICAILTDEVSATGREPTLRERGSDTPRSGIWLCVRSDLPARDVRQCIIQDL